MTKLKYINILLIAAFICLALAHTSFCKEEKEMTREDYLKEIDKVRELLKDEPENARLHNELGFYLFKVGKLGDAEKGYAKAVEFDDKFSTAYNNLGIISLLKKDYDKAEKYFSTAIASDPEYAKAVYNLGVTYFRQKKYLKAIKYYFKAKKIDENYVKDREDVKKGRAELEKALKDDPDNKVLKYLLEKANEEKSN